MKPKISGPWSLSQIEEFLGRSVIPIRLGCVSRSGWPMIFSLWYLRREGALWCATQATAKVALALKRNPRCAFEVAVNDPPYKGVRGQGMAELGPEGAVELLGALLDRYLGSRTSALAQRLLERSDDEVAIRIEPARIAAWDYTRRMTS